MIHIERYRRVVRLVEIAGRRRALVVELHPNGLSVREYRRRVGYFVPWGAVFDLGAKLAAPVVPSRRQRARS